METQHTAYRQIRSIPNTDFESLRQINSIFLAIGLRVFGNRQFKSVFGIASVFGFEVQIKLGKSLG